MSMLCTRLSALKAMKIVILALYIAYRVYLNVRALSLSPPCVAEYHFAFN